MKKPKRSDYQSGRSGAEAYQTAMKKWRASNKKVKPANNDPRPKIGNFPNREAYRQAVLKWNERRKARLKKERKDELVKKKRHQ